MDHIRKIEALQKKLEILVKAQEITNNEFESNDIQALLCSYNAANNSSGLSRQIELKKQQIEVLTEMESYNLAKNECDKLYKMRVNEIMEENKNNPDFKLDELSDEILKDAEFFKLSVLLIRNLSYDLDNFINSSPIISKMIEQKNLAMCAIKNYVTIERKKSDELERKNTEKRIRAEMSDPNYHGHY